MSKNFITFITELNNQRYLMTFERIVTNKISCGFFCPFKLTENLQLLLKKMVKLNLNLTCVCVTDESQKVESDIPFITLEELPNSELKPSVMFHAEQSRGPAFYDYFKKLNVELITLADINFMETMYNFYIQNLLPIYEVHEMLADEESKKVFRAFIKGKLTQNTKDHVFAPEPQYFLEGFLPTQGDIAIDGGAYDGATSRDFAMQGAQVYAFEMSAENYQNCIPVAEKYNFTMENLGLSNREGEELYNENGNASTKGNGNSVGRFIDLDTYVNKKDLPRVDYIKLDIEGAELDMLHGAAKTIARWKPKMAVSAYHKWDDIFTLAKYIKSIRSDYEFQFRHYRMDCTNYSLTDEERAVLKKFNLSYCLPTVAEAVLYCR